jgi:anti-anti-sigma factor
MADSSGTLFATLESSTAVIRVRGRAQAHQCPAFRRFAEEVLAGRAARLQVDLSECEYFDSTFLGTLLHLRRTPGQDGASAVSLVAPSEQCLQILGRMGAKSLFRIDPGCSVNDNSHWNVLPEEQPGQCGLDFKRNVVEAHQELAQMDGPMRDKYRVIAELAAQDLAAAQQAPAS